MKKVVRRIVSMALACMLILGLPMSSYAETTEQITVEDETERPMKLIGQEVVHIKYDGSIVREVINQKEVSILLYSLADDKVTCNASYYYLGKNSKNQPQYQVVMNVSAKVTLKSSVLSTQAEGISTWHNNTVTHSGKTGKIRGLLFIQAVIHHQIRIVMQKQQLKQLMAHIIVLLAN